MHNCKTTRDQLTEHFLDGSSDVASSLGPLAAELRECVECRQEFRALKETLRLTTRLIETATPPDNYWPGYHARLREKLHAAQHPRIEPGQSTVEKPSWIKRFFVSSIRIPVPVGLALLAIFGFLIFRNRVPPPQVERSIVQVPVEVPVIQEKTVERIVYREKPATKRPRRVTAPPRNESVAELEGFKPAEEVKLTVLKGGYRK